MALAKFKYKSFSEIYVKASAFCAYQERTQQEVRDKLYEERVPEEEIEEIISKLITENFINEERFAKVYAGGKFRLKKWGKIKIKYNLEMKGLSPYCVKKGLAEIEEEEYFKVLSELAIKKMEAEKEMNIFRKKSKIAAYLIRKGYEGDMVWDILNEME